MASHDYLWPVGECPQAICPCCDAVMVGDAKIWERLLNSC